MPATPTSILLCGLKNVPEHIAGPNRNASQVIDEDVQRLRDEGINVQHIIIQPNDGDDAAIAGWQEALRSHSRWDGVGIGFGVRGNQALTPLFERLVNTAIIEIRPPPKMIFVERFDRIYVAVRRAFPKEIA